MKRFWDKVDKSCECWLWTASCKRNAYGGFKLDGKTVGAHRVSWAIANGPIPSGMFVCHRCDNPRCVNPAHLFLGDAKANAADRNKKKRHAHGATHYSVTHPEKLARGDANGSRKRPERRPRGEAQHLAKLDAARVKAARDMHAMGATIAGLARMFGTGFSAMSSAVKRETWRHVN